MSQGTVVVLTGPSCAGKSYLERALAAVGFGRAVSHTTRLPRPGEVPGVHYHFVNLDEFNKLKADDQFVEAVQFGEHFYAMSVDSMNHALGGSGRMVVVAEPNGAAQIREFCDENDLICLNVWVACDVREQMRRFCGRIQGMQPEAVIERLTLMFTEEGLWRKSADVGRLYGAPYRYHMELWKAGPENEDIYVDGIVARCADEEQVSVAKRRLRLLDS